MKVFLDTSVLVAAVIENHEHHEVCYGILDRVQNGRSVGYVSGHSLLEMYAVLTRLPPPSRHTPEQALLTINENVIPYFQVSVLAETEYPALVRESGLSGIVGGTIYDRLHLSCAIRVGVEKLYTLNLKHFVAVAPENLSFEILSP